MIFDEKTSGIIGNILALDVMEKECQERIRRETDRVVEIRMSKQQFAADFKRATGREISQVGFMFAEKENQVPQEEQANAE